ncbi:efflux RND transporter periplasmic adaptor subunit [Umboniibacter marinipuniceus]|uniref:Membrane fusion protein (Multidrug efflux system) n=1 Tax=Umboniibacter marinipuniceus TaxID=569599 RepID=A0A3M0ABX7_9GAMM|nr:efflux RND transporter periplasmic adaptor subunit [Umboniibacter marinipuniceus]RMA80288.1 membrane fusion protein (multidrug efflux system) [Umboniibacter marinipuniceus]
MRQSIPIYLAILVGSLTGCGGPEDVEMPVPQVFVQEAKMIEYRPVGSFNARLESRNEVQLTALVSGELQAIHFEEGKVVNAGDPLFDIDPSSYAANVAAADADRIRAKSTLDNNQKTLNRALALIDDGYISQSEFDQIESDVNSAAAQLRSAEANLQRAQVDLDHASIKAATTGRMSRSNFNVGEVVGPESGPLATLIGGNMMDVIFQISEAAWYRAARNGLPDVSLYDVADVELVFNDGDVFSEVGYIDYIANRVNESTATVEVRATVPNPNDILRPGQFVTARLTLKEPQSALVVPQAAVQVDQRGTYVLAVREDNMVTRVNIVTGQRLAENVVIEEGLEEGALVIINGIHRVRAGQTVSAKIAGQEQNDDI